MQQCTENEDNIVPTRLSSKLIIQTPSADLVDLYLYEIAKTYGVPWVPESVKNKEAEESLGAPPDASLYLILDVSW